MPGIGLALDALTLAILISFLLSGLIALLPAPKAGGESLGHEALMRLLLPPLGALMAVTLGFWPAMREALGGAPDHCLDGPAQHPHLCWVHGMQGGGSFHDLGVLLVLTAAAAVSLWQAFQWAQGLGRLDLLKQIAAPEREAELHDRLHDMGLPWAGAIQVIRIDLPLCFVMGLRRPRLIVSSLVLDSMPPEQLAAVIAHEHAHLDRKDNFWRVICRLASLAHLPGLGRRAYRLWAFGAEVACDDMASRRLGSRFAVAEALVHYQRLLNRRPSAGTPLSPLGAAFVEAGSLECRVRVLLEPVLPVRPLTRHWPWLLLPLALWQVDTLHHVLEAMLEMLHG